VDFSAAEFENLLYTRVWDNLVRQPPYGRTSDILQTQVMR